MKATKRRPRKPALPVEWSCREHRVKAPAECLLCRDQMPLWPEAEEAPPRAQTPAVSESFRRRCDQAAERRRVARGAS